MYCFNCMNRLKDDTNYCYHCGKNTEPDKIAHHLAPGTILNGKYIVGNAIGEGGFGITYIGCDLNLDLKVAIKEFYPSGYANRNNTVANNVTLNYQHEGEYFKKGKEVFLQEAKNIAKFSNERGIVDVRDFFLENDTAYIIMEYLEGMTLASKMKESGIFKAEDIFYMMLPVMKSLEKMHKEQIIHRDISPSNIMLLSDGSLKLMDFGSARYFSGAEQKTMSVMLKPGFAPYEQYSRSGNQGPWTDVYGLCATIYKCITGKTPVDSLERCQNDVLKKPSDLGVSISQSLENVLMYGLAVYPDNRCQDMEELLKITEKALINDQAKIKNQGTSVTELNIKTAKIADEKYKTLFTQKAAEEKNYTALSQETYGNGNLYENSLEPHTTKPQLSQKNNKVLVALLIVLTAVIVIAVAVVTAVLVSLDNSEPNANSIMASLSATEVGTIAETTVETTVVPTTIDDSVKMIDVAGKKLSDAKKELESLGLKVEVTKEISYDVAKNYVIRQGVKIGQSLNKGDTVMLYISKGKGENNKPYDQKVVVSASSGSSYAKLNLYNWENGEWVSKFKCDATVGMGGISGNNSESNTFTPKGSFPLGVVLTDDYQDTNLETYYVSYDTAICDDISYPHLYNQIFENTGYFADVHMDYIGEKLINGSNNALIFIEHNGNGFSSSGVSVSNSSVITICGCNSSIEPTYGCIDISASNMVKLLNYLDITKNPYIITEVK